MITLIKAKHKKLDRQRKIDKYREAAHKLLKIIISEQMFDLFIKSWKSDMAILMYLDFF